MISITQLSPYFFAFRCIRILLAAPVILIAACRSSTQQPSTADAGSSSNAKTLMVLDSPTDAGPTRKAEHSSKAGERVSIPTGTLIAGSTPGDEGREPTLEPTILHVALGPFEIDKLPYPNDPAQPPRVNVTRDEARALCQERGERLCTELEWERACKGAENDMYAASNGWDPLCAKEPNLCLSGFGVHAMGGALREWTSSEMNLIDREDRARAVVRGSSARANSVDHRCAHRAGIDTTAKESDLGFRCCKGPPNAAAIPAFKTPEATFSRVPMDIHQISSLCEAYAPLSLYAKDISFFSEQEAINAVLSKGDAGAAKPGPVLTTSPVLWTPVPNEELIVIALRAKGASLIVAFYRLPDERYRLASSLVLKDESGPIVLGFSSFNKKRIIWSPCWECQGEFGAIEYKDGHRVVIVQY